jgi:DNA ligase D-like protein (predicted 3'-phosphoesterase)
MKSKSKEKLKEYMDKRDFEKTSEPELGDFSKSSKEPIFVIQKHDASNLHYDLRLEIDEVLVSWAVPKGPSTDPDVKRLAIRTEDHPLAYADFEGKIPEDEYGGGTVIIWDRGTIRNLREKKDDENMSLKESLDDGQIEIWLDGEKLKGGYVLIRTSKKGVEDEKWLLKKMEDEKADARRNPVSTEPKSVVSGKRIEEIS